MNRLHLLIDSNKCYTSFCLTLFLALSVTPIAWATEEVPFKIIDAQINYLINAENAHIIEIEPKDWRVGTTTVCDTPEKLDTLIMNQGIQIGADAKSLVYDLNKNNIDSEQIGRNICKLIPVVDYGKDWGSFKNKGYKLSLTAFPSSKLALYDETNALLGLTQVTIDNGTAVQNVKNGQHGPIPLANESIALLEKHANFVQVVKSGNAIIPKEILEQTVAEIRILKSLTQKNRGANTLKEGDKAIFEAISKSVNARAKAYRETFSTGSIQRTHANITIPVLDRNPNNFNQPVNNHIVYYAPKALVNKPDFHRQLATESSPAKGRIFVGYYVLWVAKPTSQGEVKVSEYRDITIEDLNSNFERTLYVNTGE